MSLIPVYTQLSPREFERLNAMEMDERELALVKIWEDSAELVADIDKMADITYYKLSLQLGEDRADAIMRGTYGWDPEQKTAGFGFNLVADVAQMAQELKRVIPDKSRLPDGIATLTDFYADAAARGNTVVITIT